MTGRANRGFPQIVLGLAAVFALFQWAATSLGSDRGQAGVLVGGLVVAATLCFERLWFAENFATAARGVGLGAPRRQGLVVAGSISLLLILSIPFYVWLTGAFLDLYPGWLSLLPGLFAQAGIAEETLFRGYLFGHLRRGRSFWRAAGLATIPFFAVHLWLFATMEWTIAAAAVLLSLIMSFPLSRLFELGGGAVWPPALLHFVVQGAVKIFIVSGPAFPFPIVWMALSAVVPMLAFLAGRDPVRAAEPARNPVLPEQ